MNFLDGSFQVGRLFGINIRVHMLFLIWIVFRLFSSGDFSSSLLYLSMVFGVVLMHEFGHCFGARAVGGYAENILMWPLGGLAYAHAAMRPWPQFVTVAAGPLVNVVFCVLSGLLLFAGSGGNYVPALNPFDPQPALLGGFDPPAWFLTVAMFYDVNFFLLRFNLLPVFPLDGGQLLRTLLWPFLGLRQSTIVSCYCGLAGCALFVFWGLQGGGPMLFMIAIFGGFTCWQMLGAAQAGELQEDSRFERFYGPGHDPRPWWRKLFPPNPNRAARQRPDENPNPGGWRGKLERAGKDEAELDRILRKVHDHGMQSLSYVERQTLERITRARRASEAEIERENRV